MNSQKTIPVLIFLFVGVILLAACSTDEATLEIDEAAISTSVAGTQAAAVQETTAAGDLQDSGVAFEGDLQPLEDIECYTLAESVAAALGVAVERNEVAVDFEGKTGGGCQATALGTGIDFADMPSVEAAMRGVLEVRGWAEYQSAEACLGIGGWGPGANVTCYTRDNNYCGVFVHIDPADPALCSDDEPITVCFSELASEQIVYTIDLTCAEDTMMTTDVEDEIIDPEPVDLFFAPGETSIRVPGEEPAGGINRYTLTVMEGQQMTVNLLDPSGQPIATDQIALVIWGADGTVLISSHADALTWVGDIPYTQEYFIDVKSVGSESIAYILEIIIPPPEGAGQVFPAKEPFPFGEMQSIVFSGVPPILPGEFPVEEDQPEIVAFILTSDDGLYEISLDFGTDCMGAGACHYGSAAGMKVDSDVPIGTSSFPFEIGEAQMLELQYGLTGYYVEGACGANCDDSRIWWVYGGYQYMLGLKGGQTNDVVTLVNAAIQNSIP